MTKKRLTLAEIQARRFDPGWQKKQRVWRHNSLLGYAVLMSINARAIVDADSTNQTAKLLAKEIYRLSGELGIALKERIDP